MKRNGADIRSNSSRFDFGRSVRAGLFSSNKSVRAGTAYSGSDTSHHGSGIPLPRPGCDRPPASGAAQLPLPAVNIPAADVAKAEVAPAPERSGIEATLGSGEDINNQASGVAFSIAASRRGGAQDGNSDLSCDHIATPCSVRLQKLLRIMKIDQVLVQVQRAPPWLPVLIQDSPL